MKTQRFLTILILALVGLLVCSLNAIAGDLEPSAPPGPTMKTLDEVEPRIPIGIETTPGDANSLYKITSPGSYYLTGNVTSNFKHAILIDSDDVTVDLMGYRLYSSWLIVAGDLDFDGINIVAERKNIEIRNGTISSNRSTSGMFTYRGFRNGIYAESDTEGICVKDVRVSGAGDNGIFLKGTGHIVQRCTCMRNGESGICLYNNAAVSNSTCCSNGIHGILIRDNGTATDNICDGNDDLGILAWSGSTVRNNSCGSNGGGGIGADKGCVITGNTVYNNAYMSDSVYSKGIGTGNGCVISGNAVTYTGQDSQSSHIYGIYSGYYSVVTDNIVDNNGRGVDTAVTIYGILAFTGSTVTNNSAAHNGSYSTSDFIYGVSAGNGSTVSSNTCYKTGLNSSGAMVYGIHLGNYCLVDGNTAYENNGINLHTGTGCVLGTNCAP